MENDNSSELEDFVTREFESELKDIVAREFKSELKDLVNRKGGGWFTDWVYELGEIKGAIKEALLKPFGGRSVEGDAQKLLTRLDFHSYFMKTLKSG